MQNISFELNFSGEFYQFLTSSLMRSSITLQGLKTGMENGKFWSEIGSGFGEPGGTHLPQFHLMRTRGTSN